VIENAFKILGNIDAKSLIEKTENIFKNNWEELCFDPGPPFNIQNKIQSLDTIFLFSLPEKQNIVLQKLIVNKKLLNIFKEELETISYIFDQNYKNKQIKRVSINVMRSNSVIPEHVDFMYHYESTIRVHVPIKTNENVIFKFPTVNKSINMKVGEIIEFNNNILHSGRNDSEENRVHLIIDYGEKDDPYYGEVEYDWKKYI
jgi:hypothetical protein